MSLRLGLGAAVHGGAPGIERTATVVPALESGESFLDGRAFRVPFAHRSSIAGR
jgi:hypothetical protein